MSLTYLENRHNIHDSPWSDELIERLKVLWAEGYSATAIADELGGARLTRCSVLGKVHRLKLPARKARQQPERPYVRRRRAGVPKPPAPRPQPPPPMPEPSPPTQPQMRSLTFFKLKPQHCRWPLGGLIDPPRLFCAADVHGDGVYCPFHQRIARPTDGRSAKKAAATYHYRG